MKNLSKFRSFIYRIIRFFLIIFFHAVHLIVTILHSFFYLVYCVYFIIRT